MAFTATGGNFNDIIGGLAALRRRAQMTGRNITGQDIMNIQEPVFAANREYAPMARALEEQKRQEEARLQMEKDAMDANRTGGMMQAGVNALGTGMTAYNMLKGDPVPGQEPGMISKAGTMIKNIGNNALDKATGLFGNPAPINEMPQLLNSTEPFMAGAGEIATDALATTTGDLATDAGIDTSGAILGEGVGELGTIGSTIGSIATPAAIIGGAELARGLWGGKGIGYGDKTSQQRAVDSPATAGMFGQLLPGAIFADPDTAVGKVYRAFSDAERLVMKPIDWLFGDK